MALMRTTEAQRENADYHVFNDKGTAPSGNFSASPKNSE